jgi:phage tail-like protein
MALPDLDTSVGHSFGIEIDGVVIKQIQEVSGLKLEQDVIELKQNTADGKYVIKKLPGRFKAGEITLTRGLTADNSFEKWVQDSRFGKMTAARKGGAVIVYDFEGSAIKRYKLQNAWPKSLEINTLKAG